MRNSFIDEVINLKKAGRPFATAIIVQRKIPSSGKPGDKAIITENGEIHGWIGGGCTRGIVLKEALFSIQDRKPRLVRISPNMNQSVDTDTKIYAMTCQSGGEVEVYIEPVLPKPHIIIFGTSHIAIALAKIAVAIDYQVDVFVGDPDENVFEGVNSIRNTGDIKTDDIPPSSYVVVCTQGENDAIALNAALTTNASYISFVASRKKANAIFGDLRELGVSFDQLKKIKTPAGIDIGAKDPDEVAISILAEIIQHYRQKNQEQDPANPTQLNLDNTDFYMNPVCNIPIQKSTAKHVIDYKNEKVYFCCDGCKVSFELNPEKYMSRST